METFKTKVVGVTHGKRQSHPKRLDKKTDDGLDFPDISLVREPDNKHDSNAIKVIRHEYNDITAGNVPRGLLEFAIWSMVHDQEERIHVYRKTGDRAAPATKFIHEFEHKITFAITTGIADWARSGYPVQTSITDEELILLPAD